MLDSKGFDLWADGYDRSVNLSDVNDAYPFAGYRDVLGVIYDGIRKSPGKRILDVGIGTGALAGKLYTDGYEITGIDFSENMIQIARERLPDAKIYCHDFSKGLPAELDGERFDAITCTYAIHHLEDEQKAAMIRLWQKHLAPGGRIYIGDVSFENRAALEACKIAAGDEWDDEEYYFVAEEMKKQVPDSEYRKISYCAGVLTVGEARE